MIRTTREAKKAATLEKEGSKTTQTKQKPLDNKEINKSMGNPKVLLSKENPIKDLKIKPH
ncbi:hypothetical protein [Vreelandella titanicae]|uniref:hypothetical protein n=1 Tax=Vreelandella titanicae TaxID=664683 RepID=UPI0039BF22CD